MSSKIPLLIKLKEIPEEGNDYLFTRETGELNEVLRGLIGENPYNIKAFIKPVGNVYEITGKIIAQKDVLCSFCAIDLTKDVDESFNELLFIEKSRPRGSQSSQHSYEGQEQGPFCNYLSSANFDLGEYIHEIIALTEPYQVYKGASCLEKTCDNYKKALEKGYFNDSEKPEETKKNPFSILEKVKIPH